MSDIHVTLKMPNQDGLVVDEFQTSFHYTCDTVDSAGVLSAIETFFNTINGGSSEPVAYYIGDQVSRITQVTVEYYDVTAFLNGSPHGSPFNVDTFTLAAGAASAAELPNQCCATLSYYDARDTEGTTKGDHRGRMFIGPLNEQAVANDGGLNNRILAPAFVTACTDSLVALNTQLVDATPTKQLSVWSRKDAVMRPAIGGWMQNKIDTQRRRAYGPTSRDTVTF